MSNIGVIGAGYWAQNMLRVIAGSSSSELVAVAELDESKHVAVGHHYPGVRISTDANELFNDDAIDAIYIATPPETHGRLALAALRASKHVLVEKPIATSAVATEALIEEAYVQQRTLMVGHTFLYSPPVLKVMELINNGTVGDVFYVDSQRVNLGKYQASGVMWDLAPHDLSIILHWLGEVPISVAASGRSFRSTGREDVCFITLDFPGGAVAQLQVSWLAPVKLRRTMVSGSQRMVVYDDTSGPEAVKVFNHGVDLAAPETFGEFQLSYRQGDIWIPRLDTSEPLTNEWEHFIQCTKTGRHPRSSAEQGLAVVKVLEAADRSLKTGHREPVEWRTREPHIPQPRFEALTDTTVVN